MTGVPDHVTLAAGQSSNFTGTLTAGPVSDSPFFEVDAEAANDPTNTASAVTEVYVVAETVPDQPPVVGALDHITVLPDSASVAAGTAVTYTATGYDAAGHNLGIVPDAVFTIGPDGTCTGTMCTATVAGAHTVTGTSGTISKQTTLTVTPAPAAAITTVAGDGQTASAGQQLPIPLEVLVSDAYGNPVPGANVTFTIADSGTFPSGSTTTTAVTAANGHAVADAITVGPRTGPFTVSASVPSATSATFTETVIESGRQRANLDVNMSAAAQVNAGRQFTLSVAVTVTVKNNGPNDAIKLLSALAIPFGVQVVNAGGGSVYRGAVLFRAASLRDGQAVTYTVTMVLGTTHARSLIFEALSLSATPDPVWRNNAALLIVKVVR